MAKHSLKAALMTLVMMMSLLSGCFGQPIGGAKEWVEGGVFEFEQGTPVGTWYHFPGAIDATNESALAAANISANFTANNTPYFTEGSYYGIGFTTFEPTMGITSADNLYISSWGNGPAGSTAVVQCSGLIEMKNLSDYSCVNVYDPLTPVPNSTTPTSMSTNGQTG